MVCKGWSDQCGQWLDHGQAASPCNWRQCCVASGQISKGITKTACTPTRSARWQHDPRGQWTDIGIENAMVGCTLVVDDGDTCGRHSLARASFCTFSINPRHLLHCKGRGRLWELDDSDIYERRSFAGGVVMFHADLRPYISAEKAMMSCMLLMDDNFSSPLHLLHWDPSSGAYGCHSLARGVVNCHDPCHSAPSPSAC